VCDLNELNAALTKLDARGRVEWAAHKFGDDLAATSSFGADSALMLHLATCVKPDIRVITIDTGLLFPETIQFREQLADRLNLNLVILRPPVTPETFVDEHGDMWLINPHACCGFLKREQFDKAKKQLKLRCWMTGIRRDQSFTRRDASFVMRDHVDVLKLCPVADWSARDVDRYLKQHDLPYHPLRAQGYLSIGCMPCTRKVEPGDDPRSGRWAGLDQTECGLHVHDQGSGI